MAPSTPGLLFPAISLLMLAYTNRFLSLASLMRKLIARYEETQRESDLRQIETLRFRISLLRYTQALGVSSLLFCTFCLFTIYLGYELASKILYGGAVVLMAFSLCISLWEIHRSVLALDIEIELIKSKFPSSSPKQN